METFQFKIDHLNSRLLCSVLVPPPTQPVLLRTKSVSSLVKPHKKRCRGVNQFLSEVTNHQATGKRACKETTVARMMVQYNHDGYEPCVDSVAGNIARWEERENVDDEPCKSLLKKNKSVIDMGKQKMDKYVERNVCTEMPTALAVQVFTAGVTLWGLGIVGAASQAADVTCVSAYTVRKCASRYYMSLVDVSPESIDHGVMEELLSSETSNLAGSLSS